jgi:mycothiol synthase
MPFTQKYYAGEDDYMAMRALIVESYALAGPFVYMTVGDLDWWRFTLEDEAAFMPQVPLWYDGVHLAGFVWPTAGNADLVVHPQRRDAEAEMLTWSETHAAVVDGEPARLVTWSLESDQLRQAWLAGCGYTRTDDHYIWHQFDLAGGAPEPQLPAGYGVRHVEGEADVEARVAVHRAAFHPSRMTVAKHRAVMKSLTYRRELDLVVTAPDGSFAAFCIVWFDPANQIGLFEPVGCHPEHQRRGLATAVMHEGLRRLHALGAHRAHVLAWGEKGGGSRLYPSAGFEVIDRIYAWKRING